MTRIEELEKMLEVCSHCGEGQYIEESEETNICPDCEQTLLEDEELEELNCLRLAIAFSPV